MGTATFDQAPTRDVEALKAVRARNASRASMVFGAWGIMGLYLDGWSHRVDKPETFFSPWHAMLYSAFGAGMLWFAADDLRRARLGLPRERTIGDRYAAVGGVLFALGGLGDFLWHEIFGIEVDLEALVSPTHLLLMSGALVMGAGAVITEWRQPDVRPGLGRTDEPARLVTFALGLGVALLGFFLQFASPLVEPELLQGENAQSWQVTSILFFTPLLVGPALLASRRWSLPRGAALCGALPLAIGMAILSGLDAAPQAAAILVGGVAADLLVVGRPAGDRTLARRLTVVVPVATWAAYFVAMTATSGMTWPVELWTGSLFLSVVWGILLGLMAAPPQGPATDAP